MAKKTLCYSVRVADTIDITPKAMLLETFDGKSDVFPKSAIFGNDYDTVKSEAVWVAAWILEKKSIQYSKKKSAWFTDGGKKLPNYSVKTHTPEKKSPVDNLLSELEK